jgi:hypothetical protein
MKCEEIDLMSYIEGKGSKEAKIHVVGCRKCSVEAEKLRQFMSIVLTKYALGKKVESEMDDALRSIEASKMKRLPDAVVEKIAEMRERSLTAKLKKVIGRGSGSAKAFFEDILTPQMHAMPASPKDITKTQKNKKRKKT